MLHATALKVTAMHEEKPKPLLRLVEARTIEERVDDMELANAFYVNALRLRMLAKRADNAEARKRYMDLATEELKNAVTLLNRINEE